jgi:DNA-directed RNA polymerase specialized sigma24 family protein
VVLPAAHRARLFSDPGAPLGHNLRAWCNLRGDLPLTTDDIERLYRDHARELLIYCARRTYDADAALDVVAEVFAAAFAQRRRCRGESSAEREAWLYGIARNLIAGFWRRGAAEQRAVRRLGIEVRDLSAEERDRVEGGRGARLRRGRRQARRLRAGRARPRVTRTATDGRGHAGGVPCLTATN